jgi:hypothetical protein
MSSLLNQATPWTQSTTEFSKKKPAMNAPHRKTQKKVSFDEDEAEQEGFGRPQEGFGRPQEGFGRPQEGFENRQKTENEHKKKVNLVEGLINQMNNLELENDGSHLANFNPISRPELQPLEDLEAKFPVKHHDQPDQPPLKNSYLANDPRLFDEIKGGSSYETSYSKTPYYAKMGGLNNRHLGGNAGGGNQQLLVEKLNYMIHLLEQQQHEKTDNIMEEFFLYLLLGGFMIYVVDSFTKTGKYIR